MSRMSLKAALALLEQTRAACEQLERENVSLREQLAACKPDARVPAYVVERRAAMARARAEAIASGRSVLVAAH